jgi:hypothetical protein
MLCEINPDGRNLCGGWLLSVTFGDDHILTQ